MNLPEWKIVIKNEWHKHIVLIVIQIADETVLKSLQEVFKKLMVCIPQMDYVRKTFDHLMSSYNQ